MLTDNFQHDESSYNGVLLHNYAITMMMTRTQTKKMTILSPLMTIVRFSDQFDKAALSKIVFYVLYFHIGAVKDSMSSIPHQYYRIS